MVAWLVLLFWEILLSFSPYCCPSAGFYNLWGQTTSNFRRRMWFCAWRMGVWVFTFVRRVCVLRGGGRILLDSAARATAKLAFTDGMIIIFSYVLTYIYILFRIILIHMYTFYHLYHLGISLHKWFLVEQTWDVSRSELDVGGCYSMLVALWFLWNLLRTFWLSFYLNF